MRLNPQQIDQGRRWLRDSLSASADKDLDFEQLPAMLIEAEIRRHFAGGIDDFLASGELCLRGAEAAD